jgi:(2Fe-2S) ferredoxin
VAKYLRDDRYDGWIPGMQVEVWGTQQFSRKKDRMKFNAHRMSLRSAIPQTISIRDIPVSEPIVTSTSNSKPAIIKVCGKPDCMKQGGKAMCKMLDKALSSGDWDPSIQVQLTGCMGRCSQGPNLVVMPDKKRYSNVTAQDIPKVLSQHFSANQTA